jgi:putative tricarboxylic transport membrane protein
VPTWKEQGVDVTFSSWRALIGPRGLTPQQLSYWETLVAKAAAQEEWTRELEKNGLTALSMNSEATRRLFTEQEEQLRTILTDLGLAK